MTQSSFLNKYHRHFNDPIIHHRNNDQENISWILIRTRDYFLREVIPWRRSSTLCCPRNRLIADTALPIMRYNDCLRLSFRGSTAEELTSTRSFPDYRIPNSHAPTRLKKTFFFSRRWNRELNCVCCKGTSSTEAVGRICLTAVDGCKFWPSLEGTKWEAARHTSDQCLQIKQKLQNGSEST